MKSASIARSGGARQLCARAPRVVEIAKFHAVQFEGSRFEPPSTRGDLPQLAPAWRGFEFHQTWSPFLSPCAAEATRPLIRTNEAQLTTRATLRRARACLEVIRLSLAFSFTNSVWQTNRSATYLAPRDRCKVN